jgi:hypothetical protein
MQGTAGRVVRCEFVSHLAMNAVEWQPVYGSPAGFAPWYSVRAQRDHLRRPPRGSFPYGRFPLLALGYTRSHPVDGGGRLPAAGGFPPD